MSITRNSHLARCDRSEKSYKPKADDASLSRRNRSAAIYALKATNSVTRVYLVPKITTNAAIRTASCERIKALSVQTRTLLVVKIVSSCKLVLSVAKLRIQHANRKQGVLVATLIGTNFQTAIVTG